MFTLFKPLLHKFNAHTYSVHCNIMKWIMCDKCLLSEKLHPTCKPIRHIDCQSDIPVLDLDHFLSLPHQSKFKSMRRASLCSYYYYENVDRTKPLEIYQGRKFDKCFPPKLHSSCKSDILIAAMFCEHYSSFIILPKSAKFS